MTSRTLLNAGLYLGCVVLLALPARANDDDPIVKGKKLSEWVALLKTARGNQISTITEAIGTLGPKAASAAPALIQAMKKGPGPAYRAIAALKKIGPAAAPALIEAAKGKDELLARYATNLLRNNFPEESKKAGLGSVPEELAQMKKLKPSTDLNGTSWCAANALNARRYMGTLGPDGSRKKTISFDDGKAEWTRLPFLSKQGSGNCTQDTTKNPARIELHVDKATYKGVYMVFREVDGLVCLKVKLSGAGGDYPKEVSRRLENIPRGSKEMLFTFVRIK
jgi:hypothetical protein